MSDKFTEVRCVDEDGKLFGGLGQWGYVPREEAIAEARQHAENQLREAQRALEAFDAGRVKVFHQLGPWAARNRREVME